MTDKPVWNLPDVDRGADAIATCPLASTGPQKHRGRMREKLLANGAATLVDCEILEMLFFLGIPRRDTKPLAKSVINRFGSLAAVLSLSPRDLRTVPGIEPDCVVAIRLVQEAASQLARAEALDRPVLNNWEKLTGYLRDVMARDEVPRLHALFLDNRNRLIADEAQVEALAAAILPRLLIKRALELHATALILVQCHRPGEFAFSDEEVAVTSRIKKAAFVLSVTVHDHLLGHAGEWISLRRQGLL